MERARTRTCLAALSALVACACGAAPIRSSSPVDGTRWEPSTLDAPEPGSAHGSVRAASLSLVGRRRPTVPDGDSLDIGLRLDLGAGEAPYDDAPPDYALLPEGERGFSSSLLRVVIEGPILSGVSLEWGLAAIRFQDEPLLEVLHGAELAWVAIGIRWRF